VFNPLDYPSAERVAAAFVLEWQYIEFGTPGKLRQISSALFDEEREKAARQWADATAVVRQTLRESMADLIAHLVERLAGDKDGKPKVFRNSIITNLNEFLEVFNARNITDDQQLAALVDKARRLISGVDAETLRESKNVRETVRTGFAKIQTALNGMLVDKPKRA
jgi:hypothetical protein